MDTVFILLFTIYFYHSFRRKYTFPGQCAYHRTMHICRNIYNFIVRAATAQTWSAHSVRFDLGTILEGLEIISFLEIYKIYRK